MGQEYLLQVQNVTKQYGEKVALNDFSMDICSGEIVALIGENGAGKTTLLNIICGYCKPSAGQVQYKGKNIVANPLITREFGVLIEPQFLDYISAEENLRLLSQLTNQKQDTRIKELLEKTELYSSRKKKVKEFSFGMKQRLGLCQCLLTEVGFLILDEPFVGLDPIGKELFKQTILDMAHKQNVPVLFSSHISESPNTDRSPWKPYGRSKRITIGKAQLPRGLIFNGKPWARPTAPCREATRKSSSCCW